MDWTRLLQDDIVGSTFTRFWSADEERDSGIIQRVDIGQHELWVVFKDGELEKEANLMTDGLDVIVGEEGKSFRLKDTFGSEEYLVEFIVDSDRVANS